MEKSFSFAVKVVELVKILSKEKNEYVMTKQILRSGTSIGANVSEGLGGSSKKDFVSKMYIAYKEAKETIYWLNLLHATNYLNRDSFNSFRDDCEEIIKILYSILKTSRKNINSGN
jgi:four helix bundle protein